MTENEHKPRERSVAHLWCDKRIIRWFRKNFDKRTYRKLRDVYLALCEIDSDFTEERNKDNKTKHLHSLIRSCVKYTGMDHEIVGKVMQALRDAGFIDYGKKRNEQGHVVGSYLTLYAWESNEFYEKNYISIERHIAATTRIKNDKSEEEKNSSKEEGSVCSSKEEQTNSRSATNRQPLEKKTFRTATKQHSLEHNKDKALEKKTSRSCRKDIACSQDNAAAEIMSRWEELDLSAIERKYRNSISADLEKLMSGRFFEHTQLDNGHNKYVDRSFTKDEILTAIENRARAANDLNYYPISRTTKSKIKKMPMSIWLYNAKAATSHFLQDFEKPPRRAKIKEDLVEDEYPDYTEAVKNAYVDKVLYGVEPITDWTSHEENCFRKSAKLLHQYFEKNADKIKFHDKKTYYKNAELLIKSIRYAVDKDDESENVRITPGWLCNPTAFTTRLSQYIGQQRMIKGIYD
jgi:hypothetical protein